MKNKKALRNDLSASPAFRAAILEGVENQLRELDPPETEQTYEWLIAQGDSDSAAKQRIAAVLSSEMFTILKEDQPFSLTRYATALAKFPRMPWE